MSRKGLIVAGAISLMIIFARFSLSGQEAKQEEQKAIEAYMKLMAPNENHAYFKNFVGQWDVITTMWIQPGAAPSLSQNSIEATLIMGGRFLMMKFKGMMMEQPFEGLQIMGYDGLQKKYVTFWVDNSSTYFYLTTGSRDESGKVLSETGDWPDPMTGGTTKVHATTTFISADEFRSETFMTLPDGKEFRTMENRAVRKK